MAVRYQRKAKDIKLIKDKYHTKLTPSQERAYKEFLRQHPDFPINTPDYDGAGWFLKYSKLGPDRNMHFDDEFKTPYHRTFSSHSKYATKDDPGGDWRPIGGQDPNVQNIMGRYGNIYIDPTGKRGMYVEGSNGRPILSPYEDDMLNDVRFGTREALRTASIPQSTIQPQIAKREAGGYVPRYDIGSNLGVYGTMLGTAGLGVGAAMAADPRFRKKNPYATYGTLGGGGALGLGSLGYLYSKLNSQDKPLPVDREFIDGPSPQQQLAAQQMAPVRTTYRKNPPLDYKLSPELIEACRNRIIETLGDGHVLRAKEIAKAFNENYGGAPDLFDDLFEEQSPKSSASSDKHTVNSPVFKLPTKVPFMEENRMPGTDQIMDELIEEAKHYPPDPTMSSIYGSSAYTKENMDIAAKANRKSRLEDELYQELGPKKFGVVVKRSDPDEPIEPPYELTQAHVGRRPKLIPGDDRDILDRVEKPEEYQLPPELYNPSKYTGPPGKAENPGPTISFGVGGPKPQPVKYDEFKEYFNKDAYGGRVPRYSLGGIGAGLGIGALSTAAGLGTLKWEPLTPKRNNRYIGWGMTGAGGLSTLYNIWKLKKYLADADKAAERPVRVIDQGGGNDGGPYGGPGGPPDGDPRRRDTRPTQRRVNREVQATPTERREDLIPVQGPLNRDDRFMGDTHTSGTMHPGLFGASSQPRTPEQDAQAEARAIEQEAFVKKLAVDTQYQLAEADMQGKLNAGPKPEDRHYAVPPELMPKEHELYQAPEGEIIDWGTDSPKPDIPYGKGNSGNRQFIADSAAHMAGGNPSFQNELQREMDASLFPRVSGLDDVEQLKTELAKLFPEEAEERVIELAQQLATRSQPPRRFGDSQQQHYDFDERAMTDRERENESRQDYLARRQAEIGEPPPPQVPLTQEQKDTLRNFLIAERAKTGKVSEVIPAKPRQITPVEHYEAQRRQVQQTPTPAPTQANSALVEEHLANVRRMFPTMAPAAQLRLAQISASAVQAHGQGRYDTDERNPQLLATVRSQQNELGAAQPSGFIPINRPLIPDSSSSDEELDRNWHLTLPDDSSSDDGFAYGGRVPRYGAGGAALGILGGLGSLGTAGYFATRPKPNKLAAGILGLAGLGGLGYGGYHLANMRDADIMTDEYSDVDPTLANQIQEHNINMAEQGLHGMTVADQQRALFPKPQMIDASVQAVPPVRPKLVLSRPISATQDPKLINSRTQTIEDIKLGATEAKHKLDTIVAPIENEIIKNPDLPGRENLLKTMKGTRAFMTDIGKQFRDAGVNYDTPLEVRVASGGYVPRYATGADPQEFVRPSIGTTAGNLSEGALKTAMYLQRKKRGAAVGSALGSTAGSIAAMFPATAPFAPLIGPGAELAGQGVDAILDLINEKKRRQRELSFQQQREDMAIKQQMMMRQAMANQAAVGGGMENMGMYAQGGRVPRYAFGSALARNLAALKDIEPQTWAQGGGGLAGTALGTYLAASNRFSKPVRYTGAGLGALGLLASTNAGIRGYREAKAADLLRKSDKMSDNVERAVDKENVDKLEYELAQVAHKQGKAFPEPQVTKMETIAQDDPIWRLFANKSGGRVPRYLFGWGGIGSGTVTEGEQKAQQQGAQGATGGNRGLGVNYATWNPTAGTGNWYQPQAMDNGTNLNRSGYNQVMDSSGNYRQQWNMGSGLSGIGAGIGRFLDKTRMSRILPRTLPFALSLANPLAGSALSLAQNAYRGNPLGMVMDAYGLKGNAMDYLTGNAPLGLGYDALQKNFYKNLNNWEIPMVMKRSTGNFAMDMLNKYNAYNNIRGMLRWR